MAEQRIETVSEIVAPTAKIPVPVGVKLKLADGRAYFFGPLFVGDRGRKGREACDALSALDADEGDAKRLYFFRRTGELVAALATESLALNYKDAAEIVERAVTIGIKGDLMMAILGIAPYQVEVKESDELKNAQEPSNS